ncbi:GerW family sporulation protein [Caldisalinibacter kiritimatiensis]|uniref:Sporulation protein YtfJ n=1 Tax=Caldisalinibacter kiritimatiensis TaxID=1304284 RepID=R1CWT5_9FIRM|nr:GerW family sporulation protein [Caldisalinibacter kiritimatiensis]EOD01084.1 hypothetical protein L21TH_0847 [Caldisalinibacter kiritimatiensis]
MSNHPIEGLMKTAMESIKEMVDVNTIVGDAVESPDGSVIIPISRVSFGFAAGGGEYGVNNGDTRREEYDVKKVPFGGGSGAGVSVQPVAFMVVGNGQVKLLSVEQSANILSNLFELIPKLTNSLQSNMDDKNKHKNNKHSEE